MKKYLIIILLSAFTLSVFGQESNNEEKANFFLRGDLEWGKVLGSADLPEGIDEVIGGSIEAGWQATCSNRYDPILNYPAYGFGFLTYGFPQTGVLGQPNAFYLFLNAPFKLPNNIETVALAMHDGSPIGFVKKINNDSIRAVKIFNL